MPSLISERGLKGELCAGSRFKSETALQWITTSALRLQAQEVRERLCKWKHVHLTLKEKKLSKVE